MKKIIVFLIIILGCFLTYKKYEERSLNNTKVLYIMPEETKPHEGTWLQ